MSSVVGARFSDAERAQIAAAAGRLGLNLSGFLRQSALQASARVERKVSPAVVKPHEPAEPPEAAERGDVPSAKGTSSKESPAERGLVVVGLEPGGHWVDGERIR